jgi:hypothetical protein
MLAFPVMQMKELRSQSSVNIPFGIARWGYIQYFN